MIVDMGYGGEIAKCDKCGKIIMDRVHRYTVSTMLFTGEVDAVNTYKTKYVDRFHLCKKCYKSYVEFVKGEEE